MLLVDRAIEAAKVVANSAAKIEFELDGSRREQAIEMKNDRFRLGSGFDPCLQDVFAQSNAHGRDPKIGGVELQLSTSPVEFERIAGLTAKGLLARIEFEMQVDGRRPNVL